LRDAAIAYTIEQVRKIILSSLDSPDFLNAVKNFTKKIVMSNWFVSEEEMKDTLEKTMGDLKD